MAGVPAGLPAGVRISDHISLGVIARAFPPYRVQQVLAETGKASERERDLPAQVIVRFSTSELLRGVCAMARLTASKSVWNLHPMVARNWFQGFR